MTTETTHTCSYYCERPECVRRQHDELRDRLEAVLSQQPAAGAEMEFDGPDREVLREFIRICREHKPVGPWPGERVCKAIERAMDNEKPFRFIAEADMAPERAPSMKDADRMLSGPRRAAQQAAAVDEGFVSRLAEALTAQGWDVDPDGDGSGIDQLRTAALAAQQQGGVE